MFERLTKFEAVVKRGLLFVGKKEDGRKGEREKEKDKKCQEGQRLYKKVLIQIQSKV